MFHFVVFEKADGAHISAMLVVQSQRAGVLGGKQRYLQQRSSGAFVHFVEDCGEMWRLQKLCSTASFVV